MRRTIYYTLIFSLSLAFFSPTISVAEGETGLCPENFSEGIVTVGFVDCFRVTSANSDRELVEILRLQREAECIAEPRSELIRSEILVDNSGRFFGSLTCRIGRVVPAGTISCPDDSVEVFRAFDTLVCEYFGAASENLSDATSALNADVAACVAAPPGGTVLTSSVRTIESADDDLPFFFTDLSCGFEIPALDIFECPVGFEEESRTETELECEREDEGILDLQGANELSAEVQSICQNTTAGLGRVTFAQADFDSSTQTFESEVECTISIPMYSSFIDGDIVRACDESCTEDLEQTRRCLNGGTIGGPGCTEPSTQIVTNACNTGTAINSACPLKGVPAGNIVPLLLFDEEDE